MIYAYICNIMKIIVNIVLFLFLTFLAAPTLVSLLQDDADMSIAYRCTEEEIQKEIKEVKAAPVYTELRLPVFISIRKTPVAVSANDGEHDNVSREIHSPPPNIV